MLLKTILFMHSIFCAVNIIQAMTGVKLVNSEKYIVDVAQQFIYELEDYGICNTKLSDMNQSIARKNLLGHEVIGTVHYRKGFLNTFQEVTLGQTPSSATIDENNNLARMSMKVIFSSLMMFYDYHAYLTVGNYSGTVAVPMNHMDIEFYLHKYFLNDSIIHGIKVVGYQAGAYPVRWYYEPSNHLIEIINKDVKLDFESSTAYITELWDRLLHNAIAKIPFPELCLMC